MKESEVRALDMEYLLSVAAELGLVVEPDAPRPGSIRAVDTFRIRAGCERWRPMDLRWLSKFQLGVELTNFLAIERELASQ